MKRPACISFKAHLFCMRTATGNKKVYDDSHNLVSHAIRVIFIRSGENKGAGICKGFDWTQHNSHLLSPKKQNTPVYRRFEVRPVFRKQIFPEDTVSGHTIAEVPFTNHAGLCLRRRLSTLPSTFRSSNWSTWVWHSRNYVYILFLIYMLSSRHLITQQQVVHNTSIITQLCDFHWRSIPCLA